MALIEKYSRRNLAEKLINLIENKIITDRQYGWMLGNKFMQNYALQ